MAAATDDPTCVGRPSGFRVSVGGAPAPGDAPAEPAA
jgi:hypothetical protein